jgi:hypothetical protein
MGLSLKTNISVWNRKVFLSAGIMFLAIGQEKMFLGAL